jgi:hypothetical protein
MAIFVTGPATRDGARTTIDYLSTLDEDDHVPNIAWMMRNSPLSRVRARRRIVGLSTSQPPGQTRRRFLFAARMMRTPSMPISNGSVSSKL